ncbi:MAG TPA: hypothetical protein VM557_02570 [Thermoanaerobaculia bacterium]|nr:hypothetical protein [Thermoanaerobaculia bacterium]
MNGNRLVVICMLLLLPSCGNEQAQSAADRPAAATGADTPTEMPPPAAMSGPATIIARGESEIAGVRAEIHSLDRGSDDVLTLQFSLINEGDANLDFGYTFTDPAHSVPDFSGIGGVHLIDAANREKHTVTRDADSRCVCSRKIDSIPPGGRSLLWAKYPAPPVGVERVSVMIPKFLPIDEVPIGIAAPAAPRAEGALASAAGEIPGQSVVVRRLSRGSGDIVDLRFAIINDSDEPISFGYDFADANYEVPDFNTIGGVYLLDSEQRQKHGVMRDPDNKCSCSGGLGEVKKGEKIELWAKLTAPPASTRRLSVVVPHFLPMDDVPLE